MSSFLLSCDCGKQTPVTTSQAGQTVRCSCGTQLEVPTLRGLQALPRADAASQSGRPATWDDRHRTAFLLSVLSLFPLAAAGYLAMNLPRRPTPHSNQAMDEIIKETSAGEIMAVLKELEKGIDYVAPEVAVVNRHMSETRQIMVWGIGLAIALGLICLTVSVVFLRMPQGQPRPAP